MFHYNSKRPIFVVVCRGVVVDMYTSSVNLLNSLDLLQFVYIDYFFNQESTVCVYSQPSNQRGTKYASKASIFIYVCLSVKWISN